MKNSKVNIILPVLTSIFFVILILYLKIYKNHESFNNNIKINDNINGRVQQLLNQNDFVTCENNNEQTFGSLSGRNLRGMPNGHIMSLNGAISLCKNNDECGGFTRGRHRSDMLNVLDSVKTYFKSKENYQIKNKQCHQGNADRRWQSYFKNSAIDRPTTARPTTTSRPTTARPTIDNSAAYTAAYEAMHNSWIPTQEQFYRREEPITRLLVNPDSLYAQQRGYPCEPNQYGMNCEHNQLEPPGNTDAMNTFAQEEYVDTMREWDRKQRREAARQHGRGAMFR